MIAFDVQALCAYFSIALQADLLKMRARHAKAQALGMQHVSGNLTVCTNGPPGRMAGIAAVHRNTNHACDPSPCNQSHVSWRAPQPPGQHRGSVPDPPWHWPGSAKKAPAKKEPVKKAPAEKAPAEKAPAAKAKKEKKPKAEAEPAEAEVRTRLTRPYRGVKVR